MRSVAEYVQVLTTVERAEDAASLARSLIEARLAACAQIVGPIRSVYRWQGRIEDAQEWQLLVKTTADLFPDVEAHIRENHDYETPEIIATPIVAGSASYLAWISAETDRNGAAS
ncbi:divalent-cation tolerance protein CutA [Thermostaphylospora chromogena]|uniref:Divalent cation tolerance protein n=1 Tax=Thermostaphylospora chromogena TaxID=35622 RepID=A0A1H1I567_9ACTN|nr:divalent-cation tolerance protein CutA [Thermostaphylospora chromogena]SDR32506.1 divalent cation tolerance protein [Thermostaphylospora chromogena]